MTRRTSSADSSRTSSTSGSFFSSSSSAIFSISCDFCTCHGNLGDDDHPGAARALFLAPLRADAERAAPGAVGLGNGLLWNSTMMPPVGKSGPLTHFEQRSILASGLLDQMQRGVARVRRRCAAGSRSPCRPRCPARRWRAGSGSRRAEPPAPRSGRRNWAGTRRRPRRCPPAAAARPRSGGLRCSGRRRDYRRRYCRNCPGRRPADSARRSPAPGAPCAS